MNDTQIGLAWVTAVREKEALRLEHNRVGRQFRLGKITRQAWEEWLDSVFEPRMDEITSKIAELELLTRGD